MQGEELVRVSVMIPARLLRQVDELARAEGVPRSEVIRRAIARYLGPDGYVETGIKRGWTERRLKIYGGRLEVSGEW